MNVNAGFNGDATTQDIEMGEKPADYNSMRLNFITGTIPSERLNGFER